MRRSPAWYLRLAAAFVLAVATVSALWAHGWSVNEFGWLLGGLTLWAVAEVVERTP